MTRSADGWFEAEARCGAGARYRYRLGRRPGRARSRRRAPRPTTCTARASSSIRSAYRWRHPGLARPAVARDGALRAACRHAAAALPACRRELPRPRRARRHRRRADAGQRFSRRRATGATTACCRSRPSAAYGTPDELKALIDAAHGLGLMIFLDVVYNHFGPDGNYLARLRARLLPRRRRHAVGRARSISAGREVRRFFTENALYWLMEYRFDGLRFDAVHAIADADWLDEMAAEVRATVEPGRHVHLVLEHDGNVADHLRRGFDAQWNDDAHHVLHVLLTGESDGYYADYADRPGRAAGALPRAKASSIRASPRPIAAASRAARRAPICRRPPSCCSCRTTIRSATAPFGDRLTRAASIPQALEAAIALQLLCPQIPLIFMGEEDASTDAVPVLHRSSRRTGQGRARGPAARVRGLRGLPDRRDRGRDSRSERGAKPSSAAGPRRRRAGRRQAAHSTAELLALRARPIWCRASAAPRSHRPPKRSGRPARAGALAAGRRRGADHRLQSRRASPARSSAGRPSALRLARRRGRAGLRGRLAGPATVAFLEPTQ